MSRCFPFPPPGYDSTVHLRGAPRSDSHREEKRKEKKHKKEKKEKERREGKEKKDKDREKDKHKDKKDRKEKHRKKEKHKDKDRGENPEEKSEKDARLQSARPAEGSGQKYDGHDDYRFKEDLAKRIHNEEKVAAKQSVETFGRSVQNTTMEVGCTSTRPIGVSLIKTTSSGQKYIFAAQQNNNGNALVQRRSEDTGHKATITQDRHTNMQLLPNITNTEQKGYSGSVGEPPTKVAGSGQKFDGFVSSSAEKDRRENSTSKIILHREKVRNAQSLPTSSYTSAIRENGKAEHFFADSPNSIECDSPSVSSAARAGSERHDRSVAKPSITIPRTNGSVLPTEKIEKISLSIRRKVEPNNIPTTTGATERKGIINNVLPSSASTELRRSSSRSDLCVLKDAACGVERAEKVKVGGLSEGGMPHRDDRNAENEKANKIGDDKHKDGKRERKSNNGEHNGKHHPHSVNSSKDLSQNMDLHPMLLLPHDRGSANAGDSIKKRKDREVNGFSQNHDERPTKSSRTILADVHVENGRSVPQSHGSAPFSSFKSEVRINGKEEHRSNMKMVSGTPETRKLPDLASSGAHMEEKLALSTRMPHPDTKYISQVYAVPQMEEMDEFYNQEWLFSGVPLHTQPKSVHGAESSQVWAEALRIESADVVAMPYVIPF